MADLASRTVESQNDVNVTLAKSNENAMQLHRDIQKERSVFRQEVQQERTGLQRRQKSLDVQFNTLEQDRRDLHQEGRSDLARSESFQFLALVLAAAMPLILCAYLIWMAAKSSVKQEEVNSILIHELVSAQPRLISAPNLPAIEQATADVPKQSDN